MEPVKIAGLTLKSSPTIEELRKELNPPQEEFQPTITSVPTIPEELLRITKRIEEELPKSDTNIKALAKLKGALELLN